MSPLDELMLLTGMTSLMMATGPAPPLFTLTMVAITAFILAAPPHIVLIAVAAIAALGAIATTIVIAVFVAIVFIVPSPLIDEGREDDHA